MFASIANYLLMLAYLEAEKFFLLLIMDIIMTQEEILRYSRQTAVAEIGQAGQKKLAAASVFIVGVGGLGGLASALLSGAGIGKITIADSGPLEISNLHRQMLYRTPDEGKLKTLAAAESLRSLNPHIKINAIERYMDEAAMAELFKGHSCVLDCSDNFNTRAAINRVCEKLQIPCVYGAVYAFEGEAAVFMHDGKSPCLECVFPGIGGMKDTKCTENGVAGSAAAMIASMQANEAMKLIMGLPCLAAKMLFADILNNLFSTVNLLKKRDCPICGTEI